MSERTAVQSVLGGMVELPEGVQDESITVIYLCEIPHLHLRPNCTYRTMVHPECKACAREAEPYSWPEIPPQLPGDCNQ